MIKRIASRSLLLFLICLIGYSVWFLGGVAAVPFHPDESTYLFTSSDWEDFLQNPSSQFWMADREGDARQRYRLLDAPLTPALIGLGRSIAGLPALPVDWDWGKTWQANQQAGALPSSALLWTGRMAVAVLFPISILFLFLAARRAVNEPTAWIAALLYAANALALLHARRAMAEGALLLMVTVSLWSLTRAETRAWLTAIPTALAFAAKQTLAALAPATLLAVLWQPGPQGEKTLWHRARPILLYSGLLVGMLFLLHPFLWAHPLQALSSAVKARTVLATAQQNDRPGQALTSPAQKMVSLLGNLYFTPPALAEANNYLEDTRPTDTAYLANPLNHMLRSFAAGAALFGLSIFGYLAGVLRIVHAPARHRRLALLLAAGTVQTLALLLLIPLPWQRYTLPLLPFTCLYEAYALDLLRHGFWKTARHIQTKG